MTILEAREKSGLSRKELCEWLDIPYRTLQSWELGERECPPYIEKIIVEKIIKEKADNWIHEEKRYDKLDNSSMTTEEMQRFLNREAEKGNTEDEALKSLAYILGIKFPKNNKA